MWPSKPKTFPIVFCILKSLPILNEEKIVYQLNFKVTKNIGTKFLFVDILVHILPLILFFSIYKTFTLQHSRSGIRAEGKMSISLSHKRLLFLQIKETVRYQQFQMARTDIEDF